MTDKALTAEPLRRLRDGRDSMGRRLIDVPGYTFRVFVTSCEAAPEEMIAELHAMDPDADSA